MEELIRLRNDDLLWQEVDDEVVVLDLRSSTYFKLNGSGALLWDLLGEPTNRRHLVQALVSTYGISQERASSDVDSFIESLRQRRLLAQ